MPRIVHNGQVFSSTGSPAVTLSQAQYNALSTEEKNNGTLYFIVDAKTSIGDIDDVSLSTPAVGDTLTWNGTNWVNAVNKIVQVKEFTKAYTVSANSFLNFSNDFITVPSGYSLLATLGYSSNDIMVNLPSCRPWDTSIYAFQLFNTRSTSVSNTFYIRIAFIKTEFLGG